MKWEDDHEQWDKDMLEEAVGYLKILLQCPPEKTLRKIMVAPE
jgi:hypothetical protein